MFILKNNKLYIQKGNKIVGVNVSPLDIVEVEGSEIDLTVPYKTLLPFEMRVKFGISEGTNYEFPFVSKETIKSELVEEPTDTEPLTDVETPTETPDEVVEKPKSKGGRPRKN